jgi:hypothetical protein
MWSLGDEYSYYYEDEGHDERYDVRPFREVDQERPADWSLRDEDLFVNGPSLDRRRRSHDDEFYELDEYEEDDYEETELNKEDEPPSGNFWFNPKPGLDREVQTIRQAPLERKDNFPPSTATPHRRRQSMSSSGRGRGPAKRTTFRSGTPPPPAPVADFYNRLFWYGFDPADTSSPADPTMFGGTKGKFNGLAYLNDGVGVMPAHKLNRAARREPVGIGARDGYDVGIDIEDLPYWDDDDEGAGESRAARQFSDEPILARQAPVTPPFDPPQFMRSAPTQVPHPRRSPSPEPHKSRKRSIGNRRSSYDDSDWISEEVSSWFGPEDGHVNEIRDSVRRRSSRREEAQSWSLFGALESFLGLDRIDIDSRAADYDRQMGIGRARGQRSMAPPPGPEYSQGREGSRRTDERRKGYAYRYRDDDGTPPVAELEALTVEDNDTASGESTPSRDNRTVEATESSNSDSDSEVSWEERALAVERVPPAGIPAWGPTGDLGVDARTKAILDAMEDIHVAKERVAERESAVEKAKEDVSILRVDAELEKKRIRNTIKEARVIHQRIRNIDLEIQDASRALRYAQSRLQMARDELAALERRHWAVLSFYNPVQVEEAVKDAIREFEENEPAARLYRDKSKETDEKHEERRSDIPDESL